MPFGEGHNSTINKCIESGIPLVCIDGDAPNSKRLCYSGTDWVTLGRVQAREMARLLGGKGQIQLSAVIPNDNTRKARQGIEEEMKNYPGIKILGLLNDKGNVEEAARLAAEQIQANPNIDGFIGIDAASGPGIARAVEEAGKIGKIKIVCVDNTPDIVEAVQKKVIQAAIVQKREAFEVWGFRALYAYNHPGSMIMQKYKELGMAMIPNEMLTGVLVMTPDNVGPVLDVFRYQEQVYKGMKK
jgi:ribose transport system substrate-binding protein